MSDDINPVKHPTNVSDIALPVELVALEHLKTKDGAPVTVRCEGLSELVLAEAFGALPGAKPRGLDDEGEPDPLEQMRALNSYAPALIEAGTSLIGPDGAEVRPAFYFGERPHPLSIPGRLLREGDKVLLLSAIMRLGGYGGAAGAEVFPVERIGTDDGVGVVAARAGEGGSAAPADGPVAVEA